MFRGSTTGKDTVTDQLFCLMAKNGFVNTRNRLWLTMYWLCSVLELQMDLFAGIFLELAIKEAFEALQCLLQFFLLLRIQVCLGSCDLC